MLKQIERELYFIHTGTKLVIMYWNMTVHCMCANI